MNPLLRAWSPAPPRPAARHREWGENVVTIERGTPFVCSWSGGKESCLSLYHAVKQGGLPSFLLTILNERGTRSHSHGLERTVLVEQAECLGVPLVTSTASWSDYESVFIRTLENLKQAGVEACVFGDIAIDEHREWTKRVCEQAQIAVALPVWDKPATEILAELIVLGFKAMIVAIRDGMLKRDYLGEVLGTELIEEISLCGIDPAGERGEYHTVVTDGPLFHRPLRLRKGRVVLRSGYAFLNVHLTQ